MRLSLGCPPPPSNSHHQDYYIFSRGSQPKPSFATVTGRGDNPRLSLYVCPELSHFGFYWKCLRQPFKDPFVRGHWVCVQLPYQCMLDGFFYVVFIETEARRG